VVNRHPDAPIEAELRLVGVRAAATCVAETVSGPDVRARNSFEEPDLVGVVGSTWAADAVRPTYTFPPHAVAMLTIPLR
jgi:alpha-L-arabinofuranosidase